VPNSKAAKLLKSPKWSERLQGARLALTDTNISDADLRSFKERESNSWVAAALSKAIDARLPLADVQLGEKWISLPDEVDREDVRAQAIQAVMQTILHEGRPLVLDVELAATEELGQLFEQSDTRKRLDRLMEFLDTLERLHAAAASPQFHETDLADIVADEISQGGYFKHAVRIARTEPVIVQCDKGLLRLALQNAVRNAVEATSADGPPVVVTFGADSEHAWVTVLDEGRGLPEGSNRIWEPGISAHKSKEDHFGFGLPIAQRAVHSLGGTIELRPRDPAGTACVIRWPLPNADEVA